MIAASDPQEFIPSGRQQALRHPGPLDISSDKNAVSSDYLLNQFEKVSINETQRSEYWIVRKSPSSANKHENLKIKNDKSYGVDVSKLQNSEILDHSWSWKTTDASNSQKRLKILSDFNVSKLNSNKTEIINDKSNITTPNKSTVNSGHTVHNELSENCTHTDFIEEELYVKDNVVIWTKGLISASNTKQHFDTSHITLCSYSSQNPIRHALWCTFYCERPGFDNSCDVLNQPDEPQGLALPCVCIIDSQNMLVFTVDNEDFITTLPFLVRRVWTTKFGILLEKEVDQTEERLKSEENETSPTIFSLAHPLDEVCPVAIHQGSVHLIDDVSLNIVFTSESPSLCMLYDEHTAQHSVYRIRKVQNNEWLEMSEKFASPAPNSYNLSSKLKSRLSVWDYQKGGIPQSSSSFGSRITSMGSSHSQHSSRSQSPMAAISRCQSPTMSPLIADSPWLLRSSRHHSFARRNVDANVSASIDSTNLDVTQAYHHLNPSICFEYVWTDNYMGPHDGNLVGSASKVFLIDDMIGLSYLCYLVPSRSQLSIVRIDFSKPNCPIFGMLTSVSAKDAIPIPQLHMLAILEHSGNVVLYSGLTTVGKLHIGGVLAKHSPSPYVMRNIPQFNSPFPRRSSLLPHFGTPISDPRFDEHLLSPVLPINPCVGTWNTASSHKIPDFTQTQLNGLRDAVENRITLQYTDGTYYRVTLPTLVSSPLVKSCLNALKQTLQRDAAITLFTRWYAIRNAPGPKDFSAEEEWYMFTSLLFELIGYCEEESNDMPNDHPTTPAGTAKRQRPSTVGVHNDWNILLKTKQHKDVYSSLSTVLHLQTNLSSSEYEKKDYQINKNSIFFSHIRLIHYTLHLLYEELKLNTLHTEELMYLAQFLSNVAHDLQLQNYKIYYWKDFPEMCVIHNKRNTSVLSTNDLKNVTHWSVMSDQPDSVMKHIYDMLGGIEVPPFPCIRNVNPRTKTVVELCGIYIKGNKNTNTEISLDTLVKSVIPPGARLESSKCKTIVIDGKVAEQIVVIMAEMGITTRDLDTFPAGINLLLHDALWQCRENPPSNWSADAYNLLHRPDLAAQAQIIEKSEREASSNKIGSCGSLQETLPTIKQVDDTEQEDGMEDVESVLLKLRFPEDHRVVEARRLLQSSKPVSITLVQRPDVSDHDFIEEQEKHLYGICARTMALPVGRGMFTLRTATPVITEPLPIPRLCLTGKAPPRGATVELTHIDTPQHMHLWPTFHNGVANGLRISPDAHNIDSTWIVFNKPKSTPETTMEHAGFLMALGLNGHLKNLAVMSTFDYLTKFHEMTSVGVLLGLASAMRGTADTSITKMLSIHVEALLPPTSMELDIPQNLQVGALLGIGLVYQGTAHRHMTEVLLAEIGRPPGPEMENSVDRESYSLAAGLALGLVTLRQGGRPSGLTDLNVPDTLHYYMVGGTKRPLTGSQRDKYKVPSFQIREGCSVNLDVTAPGATLALGLMYLGSGNKALADWMAPPDTQYLLDFVRPDFLMLRMLARALIMWDDIRGDRDWIENQIPETIRPFCMVKPSSVPVDVDYEAMNQAYCNIIAGACFAVGLKYAGSTNEEAFETLLHFCHMFTSLTAKSIAELAGKPTIETCLNVILLSISMVMVGTGNLQIMRIVRHLRRRVGLASSAVVTYGSHLAIHMALGLLFLGGGRYTLSNSPASVAALICAFYPKFPTHSNDNRYHLQAFRHLYVLAVEPRLVIPQDVMTGRMCYAGLRVVQLDGTSSTYRAPCLIPDLNTLSKLFVEDDRYWSVVFERGRNWDQLLKLLSSSGFIEVKQRAGCLSYLEDKLGYHSQLARTLTQSSTMPWDPPPKTIMSFSSDCTVRYFCDHFLTAVADDGSKSEMKLRQILTRVTYDCVIKDKLAVLPILITLIKVVRDLDNTPSVLQLWQLKLVCAQVLKNSFGRSLISPETLLALNQEAIATMNNWEQNIQHQVFNYILGQPLDGNPNSFKELAYYITFYDIPFSVTDCNLKLICQLSSQNYEAETIDKVLKILENCKPNISKV